MIIIQIALTQPLQPRTLHRFETVKFLVLYLHIQIGGVILWEITCFLVSCCCCRLSVIHDFIHLLPGSFPNCTRSSSLFWGTKSSLMLCQGCRIATWRGEGAGRWIMPPASAWGPATEHCPRPTSSLNAAGALPYARRYIHLNIFTALSLDQCIA